MSSESNSASTASSIASSVAFVSSDDPRREPALVSIISQLGGEPRLFRVRDLNDVQREIDSAAIRRVVFARVEDAVEGSWDEQIRLDAWVAAGVTIEIADPPLRDAAALVRIMRHWQLWNARRKRRQAIAGAVLSVIAIGAALFLAR
ncbi:MAG: hypothetical protein ACKVS9_20195 [Phycisphaerae bacterium]